MLLKDTKGFNMFPSISANIKDKIISLLYEYIIATDLAHHGNFIQRLACFCSQGNPMKIFETASSRMLFWCCIIKFSDISNVSRPFNIYMKWVESLIKERILQNSVEDILGFPCHQFDLSNIASFQIQFMDQVAMPFFKILSQFLNEPFTDVFNIYAANRMYWNIIREHTPTQLYHRN